MRGLALQDRISGYEAAARCSLVLRDWGRAQWSTLGTLAVLTQTSFIQLSLSVTSLPAQTKTDCNTYQAWNSNLTGSMSDLATERLIPRAESPTRLKQAQSRRRASTIGRPQQVHASHLYSHPRLRMAPDRDLSRVLGSRYSPNFYGCPRDY